jgi:hypothetical protein
MILFIDDDPRRQEAMRKAHGGAVVCVSTGFDGICNIQATPDKWTRIYLDCDGVQGKQIAVDIAAMDRDLFLDGLKIIIHSSNYTGAIKMRDILKPTHDVELVSFAEVVGQEQPDE